MLVNGYIREETKYCPYVIPICINQLCGLFYNNIQYFTFENELLESLLTSTNDDEWEGKTFEVNGIVCQFVLCPHVRDHSWKKDRIGFILRMKAKQPGIDTVTVNASFYCIENDSFYTNTVTNDFSNKCEFDVGTDYMVSLSECKKQKQLTFCGSVEVLQIKYKANIPKQIWNGINVRMKSKIHRCLWTIDKKSFSKNEHFGKYIDSKNWILFFQPYRQKYYLRLLQLPTNVISVNVKCKLMIEYHDHSKLLRKGEFVGSDSLSYEMNTMNIASYGMNSLMLKAMFAESVSIGYRWLQGLDKVLVRCEIEIKVVRIQNNVSILYDNWPKYGIDH